MLLKTNRTLEQNMPVVSGLATTTVLNITFGEAEYIIKIVCCLVKKTDYDGKISYIDSKYFATSNYNKFT